VAPAVFLFLFAPVSAEYLIGYDDIIGALSVVLLGIRPLLAALSPVGPELTGWLPTGVAFGAVVVWRVLMLMGRWSRRRGWGCVHVSAAAAGSLLGVAGAAFIVEPLGDVPATAKYITNAVLLAIALLPVILAARAQRQSRIEEHAR
jgi:hypothetical protein